MDVSRGYGGECKDKFQEKRKKRKEGRPQGISVTVIRLVQGEGRTKKKRARQFPLNDKK